MSEREEERHSMEPPNNSADTGSRRRPEVILSAVYLGIWTFALLVFWCFTDSSDAMGFSLVFLWVVLPVATFVVSLLIGKNDLWGRHKWWAVLVFGLMYLLAEYATFGLAYMIAGSFARLSAPRPGMLLAGGLISALGLGIGSLLGRGRAKQER
ncbi:MAG: hypothetical protein LIO51_02480 [Clostridiales bacterium]|nr:hypothetical protein [Clostridiales bacterium]